MTREEHIEKISEIVKDNQIIKAMISGQNNLLSKMRDYTSADCDEAYQRGANDVWECARRLCLNDEDGGMSASEVWGIFHKHALYSIFKDYSAQEVMKRIEEHEKQKTQIKKGDEVALRDEDRKAVIMDKGGTGDWYVFSDNACIERWSECAFYKTGRTFPQIEEVLKAMREGVENEDNRGLY